MQINRPLGAQHVALFKMRYVFGSLGHSWRMKWREIDKVFPIFFLLFLVLVLFSGAPSSSSSSFDSFLLESIFGCFCIYPFFQQ